MFIPSVHTVWCQGFAIVELLFFEHCYFGLYLGYRRQWNNYQLVAYFSKKQQKYNVLKTKKNVFKNEKTPELNCSTQEVHWAITLSKKYG